MNLVVLTTLVRAFAPWIDQMREYMFRRAAPTAALGPLMPILFNYLGRAVLRLDRLMLRWERGQLPPRPAHPSPAPRARPGAPTETPAANPRLPSKNSWLLQLHQPFALYGGAVERLLADPDTRALVEAAPQAGRILRPLARMFGLPLPDWLRLRRRPRAKPAPKPKKPREDLSDLRPIAIRFIPPKDRRRLRRLGLRFKTEP